MKKSKTTIKKEVVLSDIEIQASAVKKEEKIKINPLYQMIMWAPIVILVVLTLISASTIFSHFWRGIIWVCITLIWLVATLRFIQNRPPYVGLVVIWGRKIPVVKKEGWHILAPFFPFMYAINRINVEKRNLDFTFEDIRCRFLKKENDEKGVPQAGGEVSVNISMIYFPDYHSGHRLISFINAGEHRQVEKMIEKILEEDMRQMARDNTWEEITFSAEEIKRKLVLKLTGEELTEEVVEELNKNGLPDIADLGIKITRFNIGKVKEQGELTEAAGQLAKEQQDRRAELEELKTIYEMLKKYKRLGVPVDEALDAIQAERGKAQKQIYAIRGVEGAVGPVAAGLGAIGEVVKKTKKKKNSRKK